jgi:hypothetical protein
MGLQDGQRFRIVSREGRKLVKIKSENFQLKVADSPVCTNQQTRNSNIGLQEGCHYTDVSFGGQGGIKREREREIERETKQERY